MDKANELFHEIVVEKSREIYENLIAEEEEQDESVDESEEDTEESVDESEMDLEDSYQVEADDEMGGDEFGSDDTTDVGGDATDDLGADVSVDDEGSSEDEAMLDIKNAIAEIEAAFAELQAAKGGEFDMGSDDEVGDTDGEFGSTDDEEDDEQNETMGFAEGRRMTREYVEKVGSDWEKGSTQKSQGQSAGAGTGDKDGSPVEGKSPISSGKGKPTTGATAANILGDKSTGAGTNTGTSPAKADMGVVKSGGKFTGSGTHNVDGVKSGIKTLTNVKGGHGAEKKGAGPGPVGSGSGDKAGQTSIAPETKKQFLPQNTK